jgi:hypothetical protein
MGIRRSKTTGNMVAQCDVCFDVVDFDEDKDFEDVREAIIFDGWQTKKNAEGKWINICVDCK